LIVLLAAAELPAAEYVWWEGEAAAATNFPKRSAFSAANYPKTRHLLSGGDWLTSSGRRGKAALYARYCVQVPAAGAYALWCRKFWKHGPFRWRFGGGEWHTCARDVALADSASLATHVGANWVHLGEVTLAKGEATFELRLLAGEGENATACFDCFVLSRGVFVPNGKLKPGERSGKADEGFFAWEPAVDAFTGDAELDLRRLNERVAGEGGRLRADAKTGGFVLGGGEPVRFWAVNVGPNVVEQAHGSLDYLARKLAKLGVNMVRYHGAIFDRAADDPTRVNRKRLDGLHYLLAALKRQGIYTKLSFYFPLWFGVRPSYGIPGFEAGSGFEGKKAFAILYFDPRMQEIHLAWAKALLTTVNPYTKTPLADDPAVAIVEIVNEDSLFFWTFSKKNVPPAQWRALEERWSRWLARRHGSLAKAFAAWGGRRKGDAAGRAALLEAWFMTRQGIARSGVPKRRIADQVRFLAERQRAFYEKAVEHFRAHLGYEGLISCSNWQTADPVVLDALERYTYTAGGVIDRHGYFGGPHTGDGASYSVRVGHTFADRSALRHPDKLPIQVVQLEGRPHIISEIGWTPPNRYRVDATLLAAAYGRLQGWDGFFWFAVGSNYLNDRTMNKFPVATPVVAGTFPATALMFRRGDVTAARPVVREVLSLDDLYALEGSAAAAPQAFDALRQRDVPPGAQAAGPLGSIDPLAYYVGPVVRTFRGDPAASTQLNLAKYIDRDRKTVRSRTGELNWDYGRGVVTVSAPRCRAAAGFLGRHGPVKLGGVTIDCRNEYASVVVISLDDKPLAESARILVQAMTEDRPCGFRAEGGRITATGGPPMNVRRIVLTVTLPFPNPQSAVRNPQCVALDENGYRREVIRGTVQAPGELTFTAAPDAAYHIVRPSDRGP
jgi:hypothetical protein